MSLGPVTRTPTRRHARRGVRVAVTGAGGKTGHAVVAGLRRAGHPVRALAHRDAQAGGLVDAGAEVVVGDQRRPGDLDRLVAGCAAIYHIPPNLSGEEEGMAEAVVAAARRQGTPRVVYHSVLHPQTSAMPHHTAKLAVEDLLLESGLETVVLQPAPYLQNLAPYVRRAFDAAEVDFPYPDDVVLSMVHLDDVAAVAAMVATGTEHVGATYQLCAADVLTQGRAWQVLTALCGVDGVAYVPRRPAAWVDTHTTLQGRRAAWLTAMFDYYGRHGLRGSPLALRALLGREPRRLDEFAQELAGDLGAE